MSATFQELALMPGVGVAWYVNVSLDRFATQFKNYSSVAMQFTPGGTVYDPRIKNIGNLSRVFGTYGFTAGTVSLELENLDGGCDWLVDRTTYATQAIRARFELYCVLYPPSDFSAYAVKQLGTFSLMDPPERGLETIKLSLTDDALSDCATLALTPSINDWMGITDANRPAILAQASIDNDVASKQQGLVPNFDFNASIPLMFGKNAMPITRVAENCYVICAVAGSALFLPDGINQFLFANGAVIPPTVTISDGPHLGAKWPTYTIRRTPDIIKDGRTFHLLWVDMEIARPDYGYGATASYRDDSGVIGMLGAAGYDSKGDLSISDWSVHDLVGPISVRGVLLSHPTNDITASQSLHAATIIQDLLTYYARSPSVSIDTASFDAIRAARPTLLASGIIDSTSGSSTLGGETFHELVDGSLIKAVRSLCSLGAFDVFCDWSGTIRATAMVSDYHAQIDGLDTLDETLILPGGIERIPGIGERNAPHNRVYFSANGGRYGPVQDDAAIAAWGKVVSIQVDASWLVIEYRYDYRNGRYSAGLPEIKSTPYASNGGGIIRPVLVVRTWLNGLNLELGNYIYFSWSRGTLGGPYVNSTFRVEGLSLDPMSGTVEVTMLWVDDLRSADNLPYLLDNETLNTRCTGSGGRTATATVASTTVNFSSGNLVSDGVVVGDNLILRDATEGESSFNRNQVFRITAVATTSVTIAAAIAGTGGPFVLSTWEIQASALTYRANATYFGKTVDSTGVFSNSVVGNKLLEG